MRVINAFALRAPWQVKGANAFPASNINLDSASNWKIVENPATTPVDVTIKKGSNTSLLLMASLSFNGGSQTVYLGVRENGVNYQLSTTILTTDGPSRTMTGVIQFDGLPAGDYTYTLMFKETGSSSGYSTNSSASLVAMEIEG